MLLPLCNHKISLQNVHQFLVKMHMLAYSKETFHQDFIIFGLFLLGCNYGKFYFSCIYDKISS